MTKNPIINGLSASAYIVMVAFVMNFGMKLIPPHTNSVMAPIAIISLFTLSAAVMGYIFGYVPFQLYFDGKKKQAVQLFLQTVVAFGCLTIFMFILLFTGVFS